MKASLLVLLLSPIWKIATPDYQYQFPRDHFEHVDYQSEWWYYTGNLRAANGHRFGYELTFFRQANEFDSKLITTPDWRPTQVYLAHLAISDLDGKEFFNTERLNRAGPGLAGAGWSDSRYWNGNWQVRWLNPDKNNDAELEAVSGPLRLHLHLHPEKPLVMEGPHGVSRKGPLPGEASHYLSFTRVATSGEVEWKERRYAVNGLSWMDHEFFTEPSDNTLVGWDWMSVQLDTQDELMLYRLRRKGGQADFSSATYIDTAGKPHYLSAQQFSISPGEQWTSPETHTRYPIGWKISVPEMGLHLQVTTPLKGQELRGASAASPTYWEGAVEYRGTVREKNTKGVGYLELTGYGAPIHLGTQ